MVASYLETLSTFSPQILANACETFKRRSTRFAPSVGEIYERCAELADKQAKEARAKLTGPSNGYPTKSPEERARVQAMVSKLIAELQSTNVTGERKEKPPLPQRPVSKDEPLIVSAKLNDYLNRYSALSEEF